MIARHAKDFTWHRGCSSNSPPLKHGDQIAHPLEDSDNQIPSSPGRQRCQMPGVCPGGGGGHVEASIWPIHKLVISAYFVISCIFCGVNKSFKKNNGGDGYGNATWQFNSRCLKLFRPFSISFKVARYNFSGSIPPKFEHKQCRHKQRFGKIALTTIVLD